MTTSVACAALGVAIAVAWAAVRSVSHSYAAAELSCVRVESHVVHDVFVVRSRSIVSAILTARGALRGGLDVLLCAVLVVPFSAPSGLPSIRAALLAVHGSCASLDRAVCGSSGSMCRDE
jgi:hypothetical protein